MYLPFANLKQLFCQAFFLFPSFENTMFMCSVDVVKIVHLYALINDRRSGFQMKFRQFDQ